MATPQELYDQYKQSGDITKTRTAYESLGQLQGLDHQELQNRANYTASQVANAFIDAYAETNGKPPSPEEIQNYMGKTLTPSYIARFATEGFNYGDAKRAAIQDDLVQAPQLKVAEDRSKEAQASFENQARQNVTDQMTLADKLSQVEEDRQVRSNEKQFGQVRGRRLSEMAATGGAFNPNQQEGLNQLEAQNLRGLQDSLANIKAQSLSSKLNIAGQANRDVQSSRQFDVTSGMENKSLLQRIKEFNQSLAYSKDKDFQAQLENQRNRDLASQLGRAQAEANEPGTLDYINTGVNVLNGVANTAAAFKGKK